MRRSPKSLVTTYLQVGGPAAARSAVFVLKWMVVLTSRALLCGLLVMTTVSEATAQIVQELAVMSTGGGSAAASTFSVTSSIGQALPPGRAEASRFSVSGGFLASAVPGDVDNQEIGRAHV